MKKHKIAMKKYADMHEEIECAGKDGVVVKVRNHIPYEDKIAFAKEWIENVMMVHDDSCCYVSHEQRMYEIFLIAKYYTDIQTEGVTPQEIMDFMINDNLIGPVTDAMDRDRDELIELFYGLRDGFETRFNDDRSLARAVRTSFGFLFNGEDITESMAKAEITKDTMFNALSALQEKEANINHGQMKVGGNIIDFTKKTN